MSASSIRFLWSEELLQMMGTLVLSTFQSNKILQLSQFTTNNNNNNKKDCHYKKRRKKKKMWTKTIKMSPYHFPWKLLFISLTGYRLWLPYPISFQQKLLSRLQTIDWKFIGNTLFAVFPLNFPSFSVFVFVLAFMQVSMFLLFHLYLVRDCIVLYVFEIWWE